MCEEFSGAICKHRAAAGAAARLACIFCNRLDVRVRGERGDMVRQGPNFVET
jgi:hypothetical protein